MNHCIYCEGSYYDGRGQLVYLEKVAGCPEMGIHYRASVYGCERFYTSHGCCYWWDDDHSTFIMDTDPHAELVGELVEENGDLL